MSEPIVEITSLLLAHREGDADALNRLVPLIYDELKRIARRQLHGPASGRTLSATALVNEAYLKIVGGSGAEWSDRSHFFAVCARAMRHIIVDHARRRLAGKRGGGQLPESLDPTRLAVSGQAEFLFQLDEALDRLTSLDERLPGVVECRFFLGLSEEETGASLGISRRTVQRDWLRARAWLRQEMGPGWSGHVRSI